jgi:hypothetical protein
VLWASAAVTKEDALEAMARFPEGRDGRTYLLAGQLDRAVAALGTRAHHCKFLSDSLDRIQATLLLGEALEQKSDAAGACEAYAGVLFRWGGAKQSVSANEARARSKKLRCRAADAAVSAPAPPPR